MTAAKRVVTGGLAVLAILAGSERRPLTARAASYTLSGSPDGSGTFFVDDDLDVLVNGNVVFTENRPADSLPDHSPIAISADIGDVIEFRVRDTYGVCARLTTVYLTDAAGGSIVADPGFDIGCGRPNVNLGVVHTYAFVIPDLTTRPRAEFVAELRPGAGPEVGDAPSDFAVFQNALYFAADDEVNGRELWRLGTTGAPTLVADLDSGSGSSSPQGLTVAGDRLYFVAGTPATGRELWQYDGVNPPTPVEDIKPGSADANPLYLTAYGDQIVFRADFPTGEELAAYSPTIGFRLFNIYPDDTPGCEPQDGGCGSTPYELTVYNGILYFGAFEPTFGGELYRYDGNSIQRLSDIVANGSATPEHLTGIGSRLVFSAYNAAGWNQLYSYTIGGASTPLELVSGNRPFGAFPRTFAAFNGRAYFTASDTAVGRELWTTDGTQPGTSLVANINPGPAESIPDGFIAFNGELYFDASDATVGNELRATNGTSVRLVTDLYPGPDDSDVNGPAVLGTYLIFEARASDGQLYPWYTTGTSDSTGRVLKSDGTLINPTGDATEDAQFTLFNGALYFAANDGVRGYELWRITLGTAAPTTPTSTALASSPNPSQGGETITLTALVSAASGTPGGTVAFFDGAASLGSATLVNGVASLTTNSLSVGTHTLTASYDGDAAYAGSTSSSASQIVNGQATSTALASSLNPSFRTQPVTFTATVTGGSPTGTVSFTDGAAPLGTVPLAGGVATVTTAALSAGTHTVVATYNGDATHAGSTSNALSQVVNGISTIVGLFSSKNPSKIGDSVTFTATLNADATGTISFLDNGATLGSTAILAGQASLNVSSLAVGAHPIVARYNGDANYLPTNSATVIQTVNPLNSAPQIGPIGNRTLPWGQLLDIVTGANDIDGDPIAFSLVAPPAGASITPAGRFTWTPTSAQVGTYVLTVEASDGSLVGSRTFTVIVQPHASTIGILLPFEAAPGPVELRAELRDMTEGTPLAGQSVTFTVGTQSITAVTDAAGLARPVLPLAQPGGTVGYTASYAGTPAYLASAQTATFRINLPPVIAPVPPQQIPWGRALSVPIQITSPDGDPLNIVVVSAPAGVQFGSGVLTWTPPGSAVGPASVVIRVTDTVSTVFATVAITVLPHATSLTNLAPGAAGNGPAILLATLMDTEFGVPLSDRTVTFTVGAQTASDVTDQFGDASAKLTLAQPVAGTTLGAAFAGEAIYAASTATRPLTIFDDADGDALRDDWEINGVDVDGDSVIDLDLPAMGANPLRKDLFIEIDWMQAGNCVEAACPSLDRLRPQAAALQGLIQAFAAAPVANPDGSTGITLHVDAGPSSVMNPLTGTTWGTLARGGRVPFDVELGTLEAGSIYNWSEFDAYKQAFFDAARRGVFRYGIHASRIAYPGASGIARALGSTDVIIAAGTPEWFFLNGFSGMTVNQERGLLMHEFGHTLSLGHGGGDNVNFKPNYFSVLNYLHTFAGLPPDGRSDYSRVEEPTVDVVQPDGTTITYVGFNDWPALTFGGGGIGDLAKFPAPIASPIETIDPADLRARGVWARDGDGVAMFRGPTLIIRNSGARAFAADVYNVSGSTASYSLSLEGGWFAAPVPRGVTVAPNQFVRATFPIDTTGLTPGQYQFLLTLRNAAGEVVHQQPHPVLVLDMTDPASAARARRTAAALAQLPPSDDFEASAVAEMIDMINDAAGAWQAVVAATGRPAISATYSIDEPQVAGGLIKVIRAQSGAGTPEFLLELLSTGNLAAGRVRMRTPSGSILDALVAGRWNASTRTFDGKYVASRQTGSIVVQLKSSP